MIARKSNGSQFEAEHRQLQGVALGLIEAFAKGVSWRGRPVRCRLVYDGSEEYGTRTAVRGSRSPTHVEAAVCGEGRRGDERGGEKGNIRWQGN